MTRPLRYAWAGGCAALLLACGSVSADQLLHSPRVQPPCPTPYAAPAPKVVIHMQEPEVVYEPAPADYGRHGLFRGFAKNRRPAVATNTVTTASVLTPLSFSSGFVGQGFNLNALSLQGVTPQFVGFGAQSFGVQSSDLSELRAAQELELVGARLAAAQAVRAAEAQAYRASLQRFQSTLQGFSTRAAGDTSKVDSCCDELKQQLKELKASIDQVKTLCEEIKSKVGK